MKNGELGEHVAKQTRKVPLVCLSVCLICSSAFSLICGLKVDFSEKRGVLIACGGKRMREAWADEAGPPVIVGVCDGGTQEQCVRPLNTRQALHRVQENYVCGDCADEWEKESGRSSSQVRFTVKTTEIPQYSIYFSVERS